MKKRSRKTGRPAPVPKPGISLLVGVLIVVAVGLVGYWNSFDVPLVFDDFVTIQHNSGVRFGDRLSPGFLGGRSLLYVTFAANYALHGQEVWGYHLVNLVLHLLNGILILLVAAHIFRKVEIGEQKARAFALLAALFFIAHPVQTESVTYISSRSEVLSTSAYLLAFLVFVKVPLERVGFLLSLPVAGIMYAGLLMKETVISLPAVLIAYDFIILSASRVRPVLGRWKFYATFILGGTAVAYLLLTGPLRGAVGGTLPGHLSPWHYFLTQTRVIARYIQITLLPVGLNLDYDFPPSYSPLEPAVIASTALIVGILVVAWRLRRSQPVASFAIFWYFITLAPTSSVAPILDVIFEHRLYLPFAGLCLGFPLAIEALSSLARSRFRIQLKSSAVAAGVIVALTLGTILRNEVWRDERRLWADVVEKSPGKVRGYNALAMAHFEKGEYEQGVEVARRGIEALPDSRNILVDTIGNLYLQLGRHDDAIKAFEDAIELETSRPDPDAEFLGNEYNNLGVSYLYKWSRLRESQASMSRAEFEREKLAILEPALKAFQKSLEYDSTMSFIAFDSQINVISHLGRDREFMAEQQARLEAGEDFRARYAIGKLAFNEGGTLMDLGRQEESRQQFAAAARHFEMAAELSPTVPLFWFNYAYTLERLDRLDESIASYLQAIRISPTFVEAHHNIGQLRMRKGEYRVAIDNFEEVLRLYPGHVSSNLNLARIYMQIGDSGQARQHLANVLESSPGHSEALALWQELGS